MTKIHAQTPWLVRRRETPWRNHCGTGKRGKGLRHGARGAALWRQCDRGDSEEVEGGAT